MTRLRPLLVISILVCGLPALAAEPYTFHGVTLVACADGDTCTFNLHETHPVLARLTYRKRAVRFLGIDAPELHPARCDRERELGQAAHARLLAILGAAVTIDVTVTATDKYGRLLGRVRADGQDVAARLLAEGEPGGWMRAYRGGRRKGWC